MKHGEQVLKLIGEMKNPVGAEIGVHKGQFSEYLLQNKTDLKLYCIDPFEVYEEYYIIGHPSRQHALPKQSQWDTLFANTKKTLTKYGDRVELIRKRSVQAVNSFEDGSLDFVFIDANHLYAYVKEDILIWSPKVKLGGLIIGHDYCKEKEEFRENVCVAVHELFNDVDIYTGSGTTWWVKKGLGELKKGGH